MLPNEEAREGVRGALPSTWFGFPVYYPGEPYFAPDLIAVLDVEPHEPGTWVVSAEGKGLELALESTLAGDRDKDLVRNVERYARLGIPEYSILDLKGPRIFGYRMAKGPSHCPGSPSARPGPPRRAQEGAPQQGRFASEVLGLDVSRGDAFAPVRPIIPNSSHRILSVRSGEASSAGRNLFPLPSPA